jgi:hypothetical protein
VSWTLDPDSRPPADAEFIAAAIDSLSTMLLKTAANPDSLDPLLAPWDYPAMLGAIPLESEETWKSFGIPWPVALDSVRLLAYYTILPSEEPIARALLWYRLRDAKGQPLWTLEQAFKHGTRPWQPVIVTDAPWSPIRIFRTRPTNKNIYEFLLDPISPWQFTSTPGQPISAGHVREYTWRSVTGEAPTQRYYRRGGEVR